MPNVEKVKHFRTPPTTNPFSALQTYPFLCVCGLLPATQSQGSRVTTPRQNVYLCSLAHTKIFRALCAVVSGRRLWLLFSKASWKCQMEKSGYKLGLPTQPELRLHCFSIGPFLLSFSLFCSTGLEQASLLEEAGRMKTTTQKRKQTRIHSFHSRYRNKRSQSLKMLKTEKKK